MSESPDIVAVRRFEGGPWGPFEVTLRLAVVDGKRVPWNVELQGPGITGEAVRRIPFGSLVDEVTASMDEGTAELRRSRRALDARLGAIRRREGRRRRGPGLSVTPDLTEVVEVYREAHRLGLKPVPTIARTWRVTPPTVGGWLDKARELGLLPRKD